ncbi:NUDIX domain-containing protein [Deinococcus carri]|uniref:NUDIX domain-containing protein n=1 Tax=Deinococcus carri TaxID=1211323 RepID=UPI0031E83673
MSRVIHNAILVPCHLTSGRILVQDRRGHRPPPWGFFGGGIEVGETPVQALLRETREELGVQLAEEVVHDEGAVTGMIRDLAFTLHVFSWPFDGDLSVFTLGEGAGMELVTPEEMLRRVEPGGPDAYVTRQAQAFLRRLGASSVSR